MTTLASFGPGSWCGRLIPAAAAQQGVKETTIHALQVTLISGSGSPRSLALLLVLASALTVDG